MIQKYNDNISRRSFVLVLSHHRLWGVILLPYIIELEINNKYYRLTECLSPFPGSETLSILDQEEREVINIINEYSDRNLFHLFSKDKSVKDFMVNVKSDRIESFIRPYIERRIFKCLSLSRDAGLNVYYQKTKTATLHKEDLLILFQDYAIPLFRFTRDEDKSTYNLGLDAGGKRVDLKKSSAEIICNSPCIIREGHRILFVLDVEGIKLKPFLSKDSIEIPKKTEKRYFATFVLNAVNSFKVEGSGFEISEEIPVKKASIIVEPGLNGSPVLTLKFNYEGITIDATESKKYLTIFKDTGGTYRFRKFRRDMEWESDCRQKLESLGFYSDDDISFFIPATDSSFSTGVYPMIEAINLNFNELTEYGFTLYSRLDAQYNFKTVNLAITSQMINDWFDLKAVVLIGEWKIPFGQLRKNILGGIREYILPDGSIAILPETWFSKYRNIFEFGKSSDSSIRVHKQHFSLLGENLLDETNLIAEKLGKLLIPEEISEIQVPAGLKCQMRQYQSEGLNWLVFLQSAGLGGCLADDMGLGKTIQTLALLQHNKEQHIPGIAYKKSDQLSLFGTDETRLTSLIIVPASLIYNWENEIKRFVPGMRVCSHKGINRRKSTTRFSEFDLILSSYHTVRQDIDFVNTFHFHYIILDESQVIKNPGSALYRTMIRLRSSYKLVLTGTPVENSLTDLWSQLNFVNPGLLGDIAFFRREFAKPIEKSGDDEKEFNLRKIIKPFILRRTKLMVASDLPPMTEQTVFCDMTEEQFRLYDEEKSAVRNSILRSIESEGVEKSSIIVLQGLMRLRQISNHPVMTFEEYGSGSGKFETVLQDIESVTSEGHKILVFSSFVKHLNLYADALNIKKIRYSILTGSSTNREKIVNSFQEDNQNKVFLISLKAGGTGLNLTAADYVFILDPWWNPASEMQAMNRAHRIGQDKSVFIYRYITTDSIEEKIVRLQEKKSKLADTFITSNNPLKDIDIQDILKIIG
ncbi:MAG TPA: DEAD/DEAH box helicase [Bacteroidales bacterium]|nr:DEAD/DEAH box helicase [Bacteroidales bacterium]